jgi:hypothetical protein
VVQEGWVTVVGRIQEGVQKMFWHFFHAVGREKRKKEKEKEGGEKRRKEEEAVFQRHQFSYSSALKVAPRKR